MRTHEDKNLRLLNEKYLKKFIRKFWLQPIPEQGDEKDTPIEEEVASGVQPDLISNSGVQPDLISSTNQNFESNSYSSRQKSSSLADSNPRNNCQLMSSSSPTTPPTSRPFHRSHRRLPSYGNVDIIFLEPNH